MDTAAKKRTDFASAMHSVLSVLDSGNPYTLNKLSEETRLNFRTIRKIIDSLKSNQIFLSEKSLEVSKTDNLTMIRLKEKNGLAFYPENIQSLIIRTSYYPTTSRDEEILIHLFIHNALDVETAINIPEDKNLRELIDAEHVVKTIGNKYYLTSDGQMIAKGALRLYPELKSVVLQTNQDRQLHTQLQLSIPLAPIPALINNKLRR